MAEDLRKTLADILIEERKRSEIYGDATGGYFLNRTKKGVELREEFYSQKKGFFYKKVDFITEYSRKYGGEIIANSLIFKEGDWYYILHDFSYITCYIKTTPAIAGKYLEFWFSEKAETQEEAILLAKKWVNRNIKKPSKEMERLDRPFFWLGEEPKD